MKVVTSVCLSSKISCTSDNNEKWLEKKIIYASTDIFKNKFSMHNTETLHEWEHRLKIWTIAVIDYKRVYISTFLYILRYTHRKHRELWVLSSWSLRPMRDSL